VGCPGSVVVSATLLLTTEVVREILLLDRLGSEPEELLAEDETPENNISKCSKLLVDNTIKYSPRPIRHGRVSDDICRVHSAAGCVNPRL